MLRKLVKTGFLLIILAFGVRVFAKNKIQTLQETVSIDFSLTGDLTGQYSLSGPINSELESESSSPDSKCKITALVRKVLQKKMLSVEMWPKLDCTIDGQQSLFKLHRIYIVVDKENQSHVVKAIDMKLQKIEFNFQSVSLKKSK